MSPTTDFNSTAEENHIKGKTATTMLSCLVDAVQCPVEKYNPLSHPKSKLSAIRQNCEGSYSVTSIVRPVDKELHVVDQNNFLKLFCLMPTQSSGIHQQIRTKVAVECNVIVIDDDEDDDPIPHNRNSCITDLFGTTRPLRGDLQVNGNAASRLLQPCSRLRKLLSIDITSALGSRVLQCVMSTLKNDGMPLNPYTVSHSLAGSDNTLDYGTFCRTPVKGMFCGRLRHREFPVKFRLASAGIHYHYYCFSRADRRRFCRRFDTGLNARSRRLGRKYSRCSVDLEHLTAEEISDWRSSKRLRDYVMRMQEKDKEAAIMNSSRNAADDVITLSSDSEDEVASPAKRLDLMFRCHQCDVKLSCGGSFRHLIREHYRTCHGIVDIDIVRIVQPDGSTTMQILHVPVTVAEQRSPAVSDRLSVDVCSSATWTQPTPQDGTSLYCTSQPHVYPVSPAVPGQAQFAKDSWLLGAGDPGTPIGISGHAVPLTRPPSDILVQLQSNSQPSMTISEPVASPRKLIYRNSALMNGSVVCCADTVGSSSGSEQSSCDADVIYLD